MTAPQSALAKECGYCGKLATFTLQSEVLADENDVDLELSGMACDNCGEYNGALEASSGQGEG